MPLNTGSTLGHFEILAPLGAGGMGEVYRARDTRLGRDVAIKVLPGHLGDNRELRSRFEREAKTISSLNHPNICTLFDVGHESGTDFLVMELVEGETLAQRIARGALPGAELLRIGVQVADALDRAHRAGVVHRDLKPGNIMLAKSGAKLMDFGLARAIAPGTGAGSASGRSAMTQSPTIAAPLTAEGAIVGTFQYMSPEQLEGREADERSDLWAFGCVLHEMATGKPAFSGRSQATLISAIISSEPPAVSALAPLAPAGLDRIVRACLAKDPDERSRSAHDLKLQLRALQEAPSSSGAVAAPAMPSRSRTPALAWIVAAVAMLVAVAAIVFALRGPQSASPIHVTLEPGAHFNLIPYATGIAIAPDGRSVAYCATDSSGSTALWLRRFDSPEPTLLLPDLQLTSQSITVQIFWSPDSRAIGLIGNRAGLMTIPATGGATNQLSATSGGRGGAWSRKGVILFAPNTQGGLMSVPDHGGTLAPVTTLDASKHENSHRFPVFLPDGEHFLYAVLPPGPDGYRICAGRLGSKEVHDVLTAQSAVTYAAPGYLLYRKDGKVVAHRFDAGQLKTIGEPVPLIDAPTPTDLDAEPIATASNDGRLVVLASPPPDAQLAWIDTRGSIVRTLALPAGAWIAPRLSPDDHDAIVNNGTDVWRVDLMRDVPTRLTSGAGYHTVAAWSPDGTHIAYSAGGQGREEVEVLRADGSGAPQVLTTTSDLFKNVTDWSRDGLVMQSLRSSTMLDVVLQPYPSGALRPLAQTSFGEWGGRVSPDGKWLAYLSNEAGVGDVYVQAFPEPAHKVRVTSDGASSVWWMPGGRELRYRKRGSNEVFSVTLTPQGDELAVGAPRLLFTMPSDAVAADMTHDGQRFLASIVRGATANRRMRVVLNWQGMLK